MTKTLGKILLASVLVIGTCAQVGYSIPVSPVEKAVGQECSMSIAALKESRQQHQRCVQRIGGKESIKKSQCKEQEEKVRMDEGQFEKCKLVTSHKVIRDLAKQSDGVESAG